MDREAWWASPWGRKVGHDLGSKRACRRHGDCGSQAEDWQRGFTACSLGPDSPAGSGSEMGVGRPWGVSAGCRGGNPLLAASVLPSSSESRPQEAVHRSDSLVLLLD